MFRETSAANSAYVFAAVTESRGIVLQQRTQAGVKRRPHRFNRRRIAKLVEIESKWKHVHRLHFDQR